MAAAAASASLNIYAEENIAASVSKLEPLFEEAIHGMADAPHVMDVRNFGLMGAIELTPRPDQPGARGLEAHIKCFENGLMIRNGMDTLQFAPFLASTPDLFEKTFSIVRKVLEDIN